MPVGVILERRDIDNPWESHCWMPVAVVPGGSDVETWTEVARGAGWVRFHAGTLLLELNRDETDDYRYNLANDPPAVYVHLREDENSEAGVAPFKVTVAPSEAQAILDTEEYGLEPVEMPDAIRAWVGAFVEAYHVDQPFYKRQRTPHDPRKGGGDKERAMPPRAGPRGVR